MRVAISASCNWFWFVKESESVMKKNLTVLVMVLVPFVAFLDSARAQIEGEVGPGAGDVDCESLCIHLENLNAYVNGKKAGSDNYPVLTEHDTGEVKSSFEVKASDAGAETFQYSVSVDRILPNDFETISTSSATITLGAGAKSVVPVHYTFPNLTGRGFLVTVSVYGITSPQRRKTKYFYFRPDFEGSGPNGNGGSL